MIKKLSFIITSTSLLLVFPLLADIDDDIYGMEELVDPSQEGGAFELQFNADLISGMNINEEGYNGQNLTFDELSALLRMVFYYDPCNREALYITGNYSYTKLWWEQNPLVHRKYYNTGGIALGFFSNRLCDWIWQGQAEWTLDLDHPQFDRYSTYDLLLWGKYEYDPCTHLHVGVIVQTGMKRDRVYPIIGFDRALTDKIDLNVVFPVNMSLVYNMTEQFRLEAGTRFFSNRYRGAPDDPQPESVIGFTNTGFELGATYECERQYRFNIHAGYTMGGDLRIANANNDNPVHYDLGSSFYWGGEAAISF
ncbi:MAG: hypothetical protein H7A37_10275 [Chlamydiales bacterium]|nr:hypothetical protein [Chlamydiia bacterium]MCP5508663.1 hypothetical protein [Chlamydiales bacterium]